MKLIKTPMTESDAIKKFRQIVGNYFYDILDMFKQICNIKLPIGKLYKEYLDEIDTWNNFNRDIEGMEFSKPYYTRIIRNNI